jgi:hypothetical protein
MRFLDSLASESPCQKQLQLPPHRQAGAARGRMGENDGRGEICNGRIAEGCGVLRGGRLSHRRGKIVEIDMGDVEMGSHLMTHARPFEVCEPLAWKAPAHSSPSQPKGGWLTLLITGDL